MNRSEPRSLVMNFRTVIFALVIACTALVASGCGESKEEKAQDKVCKARAGIKSEVDSLGKLTPTTVTIDGVRSSVDSIKADLKTIGNAQADLSGDRRSELKAANTAFTASIRKIAENVLRSQSIEEAKTQLTAAVDTLGASYKSTLATFDCS
jgi:hypothetical protein